MEKGKVQRVLLLLKNMVYESTSPLEVLRFARYYRSKKGLEEEEKERLSCHHCFVLLRFGS